MVQSDLNNSDRKRADVDTVEAKTLEPLISPARQQKFELLLSLIKTQQQSLIVCGPEGIGKTTLLKRLVKSSNKQQLWNYIECEASLTLSEIVTHLSSVLSLRNERDSSTKTLKIAQKLVAQLSKISANGHTVMLILDDVGQLQAGVITKLLTFARQCKGLQLILSITPNDLFIKRITDYVIDECYVVEIPPLTEQEVEVFAQNYIQDNRDLKGVETISQSVATEIYHRSQGMPGLAVQEIARMNPQTSNLSGEFKPSHLLWLGLLGLIGLSIWGGLSYLGRFGNHSADANYVDLTNAPPPVIGTNTILEQSEVDEAVKIVNNQRAVSQTDTNDGELLDPPVISVLPTTEDILNSTLADDVVSLSEHVVKLEPTVESDDTALAVEKVPRQQQIKSVGQLDVVNTLPTILEQEQQPLIQQKSVVVNQDEIALTPKTTVKQSQFNGINGPDWILLQNKDFYTLQLMASSEKNILQRYIKQMSALRDQSAYYQMKRNGKDWYGLIYGIYPTADAAKAASKQLPESLGKPFMQQINNIQVRIREYR
jgi:DamX protein